MHHAEDPSIYFRFYTQPIFQNKDHCNYTQFSMCKFIFNECLIKCQYFRHQILNQEFCFFFMVGFSYDAQHWLQLYIKS